MDKEVRIRISSTEGRQYQVFQRLVDPLTNQEAVSLDPHVLLTYGIVGSNGSGTLYAAQPEPVTYSDQLIYTSAQGGESDTLTLAYSLNDERVDASGNFTGRIMYEVREVGGGGQDQVFLNVFLETPEISRWVLKGSSGSEINLSHAQHMPREGFAEIAFTGNSGRINIYQEMDDYPLNESSLPLAKDAVLFQTASNHAETSFPSPVPLTPKRTLLYSSSAEEDNLRIIYMLDPKRLSDLRVGTYRRNIRYILERGGKAEEASLGLAAQIEPVFKMELTFPPDGMRFEKLLPDTPPQVKEVFVRVVSNLGQPYTVTHSMLSPMMNGSGNEIEDKFFTVKVDITSGKGESRFSDFAPVPDAGEIPIYVSDSQGSSSEFKVYYKLRPYPELQAGDYSTSIVYSLGQL